MLLQKLFFYPNFGRGSGGTDQFIFVHNENVQKVGGSVQIWIMFLNNQSIEGWERCRM